MSSELIERLNRLREKAARDDATTAERFAYRSQLEADAPALLDTLSAQQGRIEVLEELSGLRASVIAEKDRRIRELSEALKPFANMAGAVERNRMALGVQGFPPNYTTPVSLSLLKAARAILSPPADEKEKVNG